MQIIATNFPEVLELVPKRFADDRGYFCETWSSKSLSKAGIELDFCQDNESVSSAKGTVRGLHCQVPPAAQDKLVRVISGVILDVAVDIRENSPNYGRWVGVELSSQKGNQLLIPKGFLHGFITLTSDVLVAYKCSNSYAPECDRGVRWDDPAIGIDWGLPADQVTLSAKDREAPLLADLGSPFKYGEAK